MRPVLLLILAAAGCATSSSSSWREELDEELAGRVAGPAERCVSAGSGRSPTIAGPAAIVIREARTIWVSRLDRDCPGFGPLATLVVETHGSQYCDGDRVRALEPGLTIPGPYCRLRGFTPYRRAR